ncbi:MAG TPA: hypothetical protein VGM78_08400 [Ilumatobacteraceae bacterium]
MSDGYDNNSGQAEPHPWQPPAPPTMPPTQPIYTPFGGAPVYGVPFNAMLAPSAQPPRRSRGKLIGVVVGIVAILAAGTFAFSQLRKNDSSGGAASPNDVAQKLITSFDHEDVLGAVDLLLPGERETFRQPMIDLVKELTRLQVTDSSASLDKIGGVDITINDPEVNVDQTNVSDITDVDITGRATVIVDGKEVPVGDFIVSLNGSRPKLDASSKNEPFHLRFTTVKEGGRWYLSLFYSLAENAARGRDVPLKGIAAVGASSPDGALDHLVTAIGDLDLKGIIASLNPNEAAALQRYAPLFLDQAQSDLDEKNAHIKLSGAEYKVTGSGSTRQVALTALTLKATQDDETLTLQVKNGCVIVDESDNHVNSCETAANMDQTIDSYLGGTGIDEAAIKKLINDERNAFKDFQVHGVTVTQVGGKWYVSPIGTATNYLLAVLRAVDRDEIQTLINDGQAVVQSYEDALNATFDTDNAFPPESFPPDTFPDDTFPADTLPAATTPDDTTPAITIPDVTFPPDTTPITTATADSTPDAGDAANWALCLSDPTTAPACIAAGVASGQYSKADIPIPFLYPQCGLFAYYSGDTYDTDSAAVLQATIEPARKCLVDAAAADGIDPTVFTPEISRPDCFKDVNPNDITNADQAAVAAAYQCVFQDP